MKQLIIEWSFKRATAGIEVAEEHLSYVCLSVTICTGINFTSCVSVFAFCIIFFCIHIGKGWYVCEMLVHSDRLICCMFPPWNSALCLTQSLIKILTVDNINLCKNVTGMWSCPYVGLAKHRVVGQLILPLWPLRAILMSRDKKCIQILDNNAFIWA